MREEAKFIAVASERCQFIELTIDIEHDRTRILYARVHFSGHLTGWGRLVQHWLVEQSRRTLLQATHL